MPPKTPPPRLTHFVCIPLVTPASRPQLQASLDAFRQSVTNKSTPENPDGIPERAIRPVGTLHLTLGVMSLLTKERVDGAIACLKSLDLRALLAAVGEPLRDDHNETAQKPLERSKQLKITLKGLTSMHDPSQTSVLYASPIDTHGTLQAVSQAIRDRFIKNGYMIAENRPLLLHATILNTVYVPGVRNQSGTGGHGKKKARLVINSKTLLDDWEDYEWMSDVEVEKIALCRMGARKVQGGDGDDEEYIVERALSMPQNVK